MPTKSTAWSCPHLLIYYCAGYRRVQRFADPYPSRSPTQGKSTIYGYCSCMAHIKKKNQKKSSTCDTKFSLSVENEQAGAGRVGRTRLARPNSQARTGTREILISPVQLNTTRIGNLTRLIHTLMLYVMTIHTVDDSGLFPISSIDDWFNYSASLAFSWCHTEESYNVQVKQP